jgi:hypothetical protein
MMQIPYYSHISLDPIVLLLLISSTHAEGQRKPHRLQGWQWEWKIRIKRQRGQYDKRRTRAENPGIVEHGL